jgi:hypothetical protein
MIPNSTLLSLPSIGEQMAEIFQSTRDGCATDEDMKRLKILREQYIALSKEVEDVMGRLWPENNPMTPDWCHRGLVEFRAEGEKIGDAIPTNTDC